MFIEVKYPDDKICLPLDENACDVSKITESGLGRNHHTRAVLEPEVF